MNFLEFYLFDNNINEVDYLMYDQKRSINIVDSFSWYKGYDKKYNNKLLEIKDVISPKRIISIFQLRMK